jgi:hypothetical protein
MIARTERYQVDCPVRFTHEGGVTGEGRLINLSTHGCALRSSTTMEEGILLTLQMQLDPKTPPVQVEMARIRWSRNDEYGIEFLLIYPKERKALLRWIRTIAVQFIH